MKSDQIINNINSSVLRSNMFLLGRFSVDSEFNLFKSLRNVKLPGSGHEDDNCYIFRYSTSHSNFDNNLVGNQISFDYFLSNRCPLLDEKYQELFNNPARADSISYQTIERITQLWSNFAKYGYVKFHEKKYSIHFNKK